MGSVTTQNTHPLKAVVKVGEERDPTGHLVSDPNGDREFRFVKVRGGITVSQGVCLHAWRLSGISNDVFNVTPDAAASVKAIARDFVGIAVCDSTATSGMHVYAMTKGKLGKVTQSRYGGTVWARVSAAVAAGQMLGASTRGAGSAMILFRLPSVWDATSAGDGQSTLQQAVCLALSSPPTGNSQLTRGIIHSPLVHGGGGGWGPGITG